MITWNNTRIYSNIDINVDNLASRKTTNTYFMELENLCLDINNIKNGVEAFVISTGIVYGYGEN